MPTLYSEDSVLDMSEPADSHIADPESVEQPKDPIALSMSDQEWTARLVGLLTHLDYYRSTMETHRLNDESGLLIEKAEAMVQITEDLARKVTFSPALADKMTAAIAKAGTFFTAASSLRRQQGKGMLANMLNALSGPDQFSPELIRDYLFSGVETLNGYFSLFTERYSSTTVSRRWVDAASAFLAEMKQTIRQLPEA